ncbi:hypothetical protein HS7_12960 [Sulfolobales archaeon HS-7]|nr:hypothetical protein HS7_12960 [Sulfolobales archaeon HS-7]
MDKVKALLDAYLSRKSIPPFEVTKQEAEQIFNDFSNELVKREGFGGYKISLVTRDSLQRFHGEEPMYGVLTKPMITEEKRVELWFEKHFIEVEVVFLCNECREDNVPSCIEDVRLGLEIPGTRFNTWEVSALQLKADDSAAGRLFLGGQVELPVKLTSLFINGKLMGRGKPDFIYGGPLDMLRWLTKRVRVVNGFVSSGVFVGPFDVKPGDKISVDGDEFIEVQLVSSSK